jgi:hypothetical protein
MWSFFVADFADIADGGAEPMVTPALGVLASYIGFQSA